MRKRSFDPAETDAVLASQHAYLSSSGSTVKPYDDRSDRATGYVPLGTGSLTTRRSHRTARDSPICSTVARVPGSSRERARATDRGVGKIGEKLGLLDDRYVIYRPNDPAQKVAWGRAVMAWIAGNALFGGVYALGRATGTEGPVLVVGSLAIVVFLVGYVIWRRRRNRRLTGSPRTWPAADPFPTESKTTLLLEVSDSLRALSDRARAEGRPLDATAYRRAADVAGGLASSPFDRSRISLIVALLPTAQGEQDEVRTLLETLALAEHRT